MCLKKAGSKLMFVFQDGVACVRKAFVALGKTDLGKFDKQRVGMAFCAVLKSAIGESVLITERQCSLLCICECQLFLIPR